MSAKLAMVCGGQEFPVVHRHLRTLRQTSEIVAADLDEAVTTAAIRHVIAGF